MYIYGVYAHKSYIIYAVFLSANCFVYTSLFQKLIQRKAREMDEERDRDRGGSFSWPL